MIKVTIDGMLDDGTPVKSVKLKNTSASIDDTVKILKLEGFVEEQSRKNNIESVFNDNYKMEYLKKHGYEELMYDVNHSVGHVMPPIMNVIIKLIRALYKERCIADNAISSLNSVINDAIVSLENLKWGEKTD